MDPRVQQLLDFLEESRLVMTWIDILDIVFIGAFLSILFVWLKGKALRTLFFAVVPLLLIFLAASSLKMFLTSILFQFGFIALTIAVIVAFQEDIRRALNSFSTWGLWKKRRHVGHPEQLAEILVECIRSFSSDRCGALIVLQGKEPLAPHIRAGILVGGTASVPLLKSIFDHHSPGHDGGVTIINGRVHELGVHLPLSRNSEETGRLGTRHAAALGLVEQCDALVLVVSEETGSVSVGRNGELGVMKSVSVLRDIIENHLQSLGPVRVYRSIFRIPWFRLSGSFVMAFCLWLAFARPTHLVQRTVDIPILYRNLSKKWEVKAPSPSKVKVTLLGPEGPLLGLDASALAASLDLAKVKDGTQKMLLTEESFSLPGRVTVKRIQPSEVRVEAYPTSEHEVPVQISWISKSGRTPSSRQYGVSPSQVVVRIPKSKTVPKYLDTEAVDWKELKKQGSIQVKIRTDGTVLEVNPTVVELSLSK